MTDASRPVGLGIAAAGALAEAAGFALDAWLHAHDPSLSERESVFTLTNGGHALVGVGLVLVVWGVTRAWGGSLLLPAALSAAVAVPALALSQVGGDGHTHDGALADARARAARIVPGLAHEHDPVPSPSPMDPSTRAALGAQLVEARGVALRYPTVAHAEAAGYRMVVPYVPLIGAHYLRHDLLAVPFSVDRPAMLLYDGVRPESTVVGLSYYVASANAPSGFAGQDDHWHRHIGLCFDDRLVVVGGEGLSHAQCDALGGHKVAGTDGWMVHAWVAPGWESPDGVFSAENRLLL